MCIPSEVIELIYGVSISPVLPYERHLPFVHTDPTTVLQFRADDCSIGVTEVDLLEYQVKVKGTNPNPVEDDDDADDDDQLNISRRNISRRRPMRKVYLPISENERNDVLSTLTTTSVLPNMLKTFCVPSFPLQILQVSHHHGTDIHLPKHEHAVKALIDDLTLGLAMPTPKTTPTTTQKTKEDTANTSSNSTATSSPLTVVHVKSPTTHAHHLVLLTPSSHKVISLPRPLNGYDVSPTHLTVWDDLGYASFTLRPLTESDRVDVPNVTYATTVAGGRTLVRAGGGVRVDGEEVEYRGMDKLHSTHLLPNGRLWHITLSGEALCNGLVIHLVHIWSHP